MFYRLSRILSLALLISAAFASEESELENFDDAAESFAEFVPTDPDSVSGFFGFRSEDNGDSCSISGFFDSGLASSKNSDYRLKVESSNDFAPVDISAVFDRVEILPETQSSNYFKYTFPKSELNCEEVPGQELVLYLYAEPIGSANIQKISHEQDPKIDFIQKLDPECSSTPPSSG